MIIHTGRAVPTFAEKWDPSDSDFIWFSWEDRLNGEVIVGSSWIAPQGWTVSGEQMSATVTDSDGIQYTSVNGALFSTSETSGSHIISNRVTLSDGRVYERSVKVKVKQL